MYCEVFLNSLLRSDGMVAAAAVEAVGKRHIRACCGTVEKAVDTAMQQNRKNAVPMVFSMGPRRLSITPSAGSGTVSPNQSRLLFSFR